MTESAQGDGYQLSGTCNCPKIMLHKTNIRSIQLTEVKCKKEKCKTARVVCPNIFLACLCTAMMTGCFSQNV